MILNYHWTLPFTGMILIFCVGIRFARLTSGPRTALTITVCLVDELIAFDHNFFNITLVIYLLLGYNRDQLCILCGNHGPGLKFALASNVLATSHAF